jgi:hypothetical protein
MHFYSGQPMHFYSGVDIRRVPRFAAALFRGESAGAGRGVVHRSPPASRRRPRLVLVIEAAHGEPGA